MSDAQPGGAGPDPAAGGQPSEEEIRAYLGQLREAPVDTVVAEVLSGLLNAAQVKLGRRDARLLIDLTASVVDTGRERLPGELTQQVDQALTQLRMAQVEAERQVAAEGHAEPSDLTEHGDAPAQDATDRGQQGPPPSEGGPAGGPGVSDAASRLWIPGR